MAPVLMTTTAPTMSTFSGLYSMAFRLAAYASQWRLTKATLASLHTATITPVVALLPHVGPSCVSWDPFANHPQPAPHGPNVGATLAVWPRLMAASRQRRPSAGHQAREAEQPGLMGALISVGNMLVLLQ